MSVADRLRVGAGMAARVLLSVSGIEEMRETRRRRSAPLRFLDGITHDEFAMLAREVGKRTPRVTGVAVTGMQVNLVVRSNSGLTDWTARVDFSDYGHLTGRYWLSTDNAESMVPQHFAKAMREEIRTRIAG